jgi:hypothetical protein
MQNSLEIMEMMDILTYSDRRFHGNDSGGGGNEREGRKILHPYESPISNLKS